LAHQLDYIHYEHLLKGFDFIDNNGVPKDNEWNEYWIFHNNKLYPFKYSVEKASELRNLPIGIQTGNVIEAIKKGTAIIEPHGLMMVLEPLSDDPDLFLRTPDQAYAICKAVGSPSCKILYDMYHIQRNQGNIIPTLDWVYDEIGYYQVGDNSGRNEPGTGEINYKYIFKLIYDKGYKGVVGMEHGNAGAGKAGELALIKAYREADSFI
jgi:hydroxypyruvate isomerase